MLRTKPRSARFDFFLKPHALQKSLINHDTLQEIARVVDSLGRAQASRAKSRDHTSQKKITDAEIETKMKSQLFKRSLASV